jgi:carbamoyltransferase
VPLTFTPNRITQTAMQAIETLRRSKGLGAVMMFAEEGMVFATWHGVPAQAREGGRFRRWLGEWRTATGAGILAPQW